MMHDTGRHCQSIRGFSVPMSDSPVDPDKPREDRRTYRFGRLLGVSATLTEDVTMRRILRAALGTLAVGCVLAIGTTTARADHGRHGGYGGGHGGYGRGYSGY